MINFRVPDESDIPTIAGWIASDPEHSAKGMQPDFFFATDRLSLVLGDDEGPGIYVRVDPEAPESVRIHIQFSPNEVRSAKTLLRAWPEFSRRIWESGVKRMVFESKSSLLTAFCKRAFHFEQVEGADDYELLRAD